MKRQCDVLELIKKAIGQILNRPSNTHNLLRVVEETTPAIAEAVPKASKVVDVVQESPEVTRVVLESPPEVTGAMGETPAGIVEIVERSKDWDQDSMEDLFADDSIFNGFCEPFYEPNNNGTVTTSVSIGSDEWRRGVARDSAGNVIHVSFNIFNWRIFMGNLTN